MTSMCGMTAFPFAEGKFGGRKSVIWLWLWEGEITD